MNRRVSVILSTAVVVIFVMSFSPAAQAAQCGAPAEAEAEPVGATLLLDDSSDLNLNFEQGTGEKRLLLLFDVSGCRLSSVDGIVAKANSGDLPKSTFGKPSIETDGKFLEVEIPISADEFSPGKYSGTVRVSGGSVVPTIQGVTLQRSEGLFLPTLLVFVFAVVGLAGAAFLAFANKAKAESFKPVRIVFAVVGVVVAAGAIWKGSYADAEIWKPDAVTIFVLFVSVVPAAFGAAASALAGKGAAE